ncbi:EAL domain-containing protein [Sphingomonadaceae bacterium jetA1]|jgi:diguanylate cyclase (GGDEF)-like protein|uniref:putative bifunctional diguanylate cyclase/phosphodiesterase n=1 Tax=Facivitalis istanbulensis TaxID=3075838 RepID=UPI003479BF86
MPGTPAPPAPATPSARFFAAALAAGTLLVAVAVLLLELGQGPVAKIVLLAVAAALAAIHWRFPGGGAEVATQNDSHDPLTGLANRRAFHAAGQTMIDGGLRMRKVALLLLDIDRFRAVTGSFGHEAGDALLLHVARTLRGEAPSDAIAARFEGDSFGLLLPLQGDGRARIERLAERLAIRLNQPVRLGAHEHTPRAAIAIAQIGGPGATIDQLVRHADLALIAAKQRGDGRPLWFDPTMESAMAERNAIIADLRSALAQDAITPRFDPQIDLGTGRLTGFEVTGAWKHPALGMLDTDRFMPVAESCGLAGDVSLSLMRQAMTSARDWDPSLTLSFPLVVSQFQDAWLAQKIIKRLTECGFPAHRLEIEITEDALFANLALAQSIVVSLKNQGIALALDDFGSGYSSLAHLRALPFDRVRIDPDFIGGMKGDTERTAIVHAIVQLGDNLNLPIAAKGLRDSETLARLREIGCAHAQGPFYGAPLDGAQVRQLLAEKRLLIGAAAPAGMITSPRLAG